MNKKKKKLNKVHLRRFLIITLAFLILLFIIILCNNIYKKNNQYKDLSILFNNEFIKPVHSIIIEDENIYFSRDDIEKLFDPTIYYNEAEKELITTYNTHVALLKLNESLGIIDDETIEFNGVLKEIDDKRYLPITDLKTLYDIEVGYSNKTNRIIIETTRNEKKEAKVILKTHLKKKSNIFSRNIENLIIGDKVTVLEENSKYKKVRTACGNIGYIKAKDLADEKIVREAEIKAENKELKVYKNYSNISGVYDNLDVDQNLLNVVTPTFFCIDKNSKVLDRTTSSTATYAVYKNWAETNNLQILPSLEDNQSVSQSLLSYMQRTQIINSLKELILKYNYIGININFDSIDEINSFYRFILELSPRFKRAGLKIAVTLNSNIDRTRIENIVDYIIEE